MSASGARSGVTGGAAADAAAGDERVCVHGGGGGGAGVCGPAGECAEVVMNEMLLPVHTHSNGVMMGGHIMAWMDLCAGIAAKRHCRFHVVTASMDDLYFEHHAVLGDVVRIRARVNRAFTKSMEVSVKVEAYDPLSDKPAKSVCGAFFTFVRGDGAPIAKVVPRTDEHRREYEAAGQRRDVRLARRRITQRRRRVQRAEADRAAESAPSAAAGGGSAPLAAPVRASDVECGEYLASPPICSVPTPETRHVEGRTSPFYRFGRESCVQMTYLVLPSDANTVGITFGGQIMKWIENAASISAYRHSRQMCANVSVDSLHFLQPCKVGEAVVILSQVNRAFDDLYMEIGITVEAEDLMSGQRRHCCSGYTTYVGLGLDDKPVPVPHVVPETDEEIRRFHNAQQRREMRSQPALSLEDLTRRSADTRLPYTNELPNLRWSACTTPSRPEDDGTGDDA